MLVIKQGYNRIEVDTIDSVNGSNIIIASKPIVCSPSKVVIPNSNDMITPSPVVEIQIPVDYELDYVNISRVGLNASTFSQIIHFTNLSNKAVELRDPFNTTLESKARKSFWYTRNNSTVECYELPRGDYVKKSDVANFLTADRLATELQQVETTISSSLITLGNRVTELENKGTGTATTTPATTPISDTELQTKVSTIVDEKLKTLEDELQSIVDEINKP